MQLYFDFLSPYAYLAWKAIFPLAARHGRVVKPRPVVLAALLSHHGHKGPAEIPGKRIYIFKNILRIAAREGVVLVPPPAHPFNPLLALRVAALEHPEQKRIIDVLFDATWAGGGGVGDPVSVKAALDGGGLDGDALIAASESGRGALRSNTEAALNAGAFGVPTLVVDDELFWGYDAFSDVDRFLSGTDTYDRALLDRWRDVPATATRNPPR